MATSFYSLLCSRTQSALVAAAGGVLAALMVTAPVDAQTNVFFRDSRSNVNPLPAPSGPDGNWNEDLNWWDNFNNNFIPDHSIGDGEQAYIQNGGTAYVDQNGGIAPGRIIIGNDGGTSGGLEVRNNGVLNVLEGTATNGGITIGGSGIGTVDVQPGGTLTAAGPISLFANSSLKVGGLSGGTATLSGSTATLRSGVQVYPNAAFSTDAALTFTNSASYDVVVTGNGANGSISAGSTATLGGSLNLNFSGYSPSAGDSWTVIEADTILGNFSSVNTNANLAFNQSLVISRPDLGGGRVGFTASVEEAIVLEVNRDTGSVTMTHPGSSIITLDGYYIGSEAGLLSANPANWNSFAESGQFGNDWVETQQTVNNIGELKAVGDATYSGTFSLGNLYNPLAGTFGESSEDLEFRFRRSADGAEIPGVIQYTGTKVNNLLLQVDPSGAGDAYLRNTSNTTVEIDAYEILSASGSLSTAGWDSLDEQDATGNVWLEALNNTANQLAEFDSQGFTTLAPGALLNLGPLFTGGMQDLEFNFLMMGNEDGIAGAVVYEAFDPGAGLAGDFNQDNTVNLADYTVWRDKLGAAGLPNDNGLGTVGSAHYDLWKSQFGQSLPGAIATAAAVPEPATVCLLLSAFGLAACRRRR